MVPGHNYMPYSIAEDTTQFVYSRQRNQTDGETYSKMTSFHSAIRYYTNYWGGKGINDFT